MTDGASSAQSRSCRFHERLRDFKFSTPAQTQSPALRCTVALHTQSLPPPRDRPPSNPGHARPLASPRSPHIQRSNRPQVPVASLCTVITHAAHTSHVHTPHQCAGLRPPQGRCATPRRPHTAAAAHAQSLIDARTFFVLTLANSSTPMASAACMPRLPWAAGATVSRASTSVNSL